MASGVHLWPKNTPNTPKTRHCGNGSELYSRRIANSLLKHAHAPSVGLEANPPATIRPPPPHPPPGWVWPIHPPPPPPPPPTPHPTPLSPPSVPPPVSHGAPIVHEQRHIPVWGVVVELGLLLQLQCLLQELLKPPLRHEHRRRDHWLDLAQQRNAGAAARPAAPNAETNPGTDACQREGGGGRERERDRGTKGRRERRETGKERSLRSSHPVHLSSFRIAATSTHITNPLRVWRRSTS